jgi:preprotein translocase subunit YajC
MFDIAYAQSAPGIGGPGPIMTIFPFIIIFAIMYFMVIRPQQKKQRQLQDTISHLKAGDKVVTTGAASLLAEELKSQIEGD